MLQDLSVSVIVPSFMHEQYILECLNSIYDQSYKDIELIIVDDNSSDRTYDLCRKILDTSFRKRFKRCVAVRNEINLGAHESINRGISLASGSYITIINSDDTYASSRLEKMIDAIGPYNCGICFTLVNIFTDFEKIPQSNDLPHEFLLFTLRQKMDLVRDAAVSFCLLRRNIAVSTGNLLFSRNLYESVGKFLPLRYCHDWDFILQASYFVEPVVIHEPLYNYRIHASNSFSSLQDMASVETEIVYRRLFRRGLSGKSPNELFPSQQNWPGYFETFVEEIDKSFYYNIEKQNYNPKWRIYDKKNSL